MKHMITLTLWLLLYGSLSANNLQISNLNIASIDTGNGLATLQFDVSWDNSWRDATNYDALWFFVKYRQQGMTGAWSHASLSLTGHQAGTGMSFDVSSDQLGAFYFRTANGTGTVNQTQVELVWDYASDGLTSVNVVDINLMGMEMVYIPQGAFWLGDGENRVGEIYGNFEAGATGNPFQVTSEAALTLGGGTAGSLGNSNKEGMHCCQGLLNGAADDFDDTNSQNLGASFPKGFNAFYSMKYEITQEQWVEMLNMLDATQAALLTDTGHFVGSNYANNRYNITGTHPNFTTSTPHIPMIYLGWVQGAAFADWTGLRPMTELEFEKACRGPEIPVMGEYAWGNASLDLSDNLNFSNMDTANEGIGTGYSTTAGNCWIRGGSQTRNVIARVGIFAAHANNSGRMTSGATYYGLMEMSGNAWDRCVSVGHSQGRGYNGSHGDGYLAASGHADEATWPGQFGNGIVETNLGMGYRGAGFNFPTPIDDNARVSSRRLATEFWNVTLYDDGMRFVRTED